MNPYVEVSLGDALVGTVPPAVGADLQPVWDHTLQPHEFAVGQELHFKVLDKNNWPRKDVVIGIGSVRLSAEHLGGAERRSVEHSVQLHKKHPNEKPEFTGTVNICMNFMVAGSTGEVALPPPSSSPPASVTSGPPTATLAEPPSAPRPSELGSTRQLSQSSALNNATSPTAQGSPPDDASVTSGTGRPSAAAVVVDPVVAERRQLLVTHHYYGRKVYQQRWQPVFCTDGVRRLWERQKCLRISCCVCTCTSGTAAVAWAASCLHLLG